MNWNEFAKEVHQVAVEKGWWDRPVSFDDFILMCHCELSKAVEEWRRGRPNVYHVCEPSDGKPCALDCGEGCTIASGDPCEHRGKKPEGVAVELADVILRILDWLVVKGDVHSLVETKYPPLTFSLMVNELHAALVRTWNDPNEGLRELRLCRIVSLILGWAEREGVDMESVLREKHEYNKRRPYRHGGETL